MKANREIYGAKAEVLIKFNGELRDLASHIEKKLFNTKFYFDTEIEPPHQEIAMCEVLGFEVWLKGRSGSDNYNFQLTMETSHSNDAIFHDRMHDLSQWLRGFISDIGDLEATV